MAIASVKVRPFQYANFVHLVIKDIPGQAKGDVALDVGDAFPTDAAAGDFWDELREGWIMHCRQRRTTSNPQVGE